MPAFSFYFLLMVFLLTAAMVLLVYALLLPDRSRQRRVELQDMPSASDGSPQNRLSESLVQWMQPLARLALPADGWENSPIRLRFMNAGWRGKRIPTLFFGAKTMLALSMPIVAMLLSGDHWHALVSGSGWLVLSLSAAMGYYLPNVYLHRRLRERQREIMENFPDVLDLMTICVEAGLSLDQALLRVTDELELKSKVLAQELQLVLLEMRTGFTKEAALRHLALRTGVEDIDLLVAMLIQTDRFGTNIGDALRVHSDNLRSQRRHQAEEAAAKIAVKLLMPLIFFVFPTLLLVLMGPALIQIYRVLLPAMTG